MKDSTAWKWQQKIQKCEMKEKKIARTVYEEEVVINH